jgi:hypothetical protein
VSSKKSGCFIGILRGPERSAGYPFVQDKSDLRVASAIRRERTEQLKVKLSLRMKLNFIFLQRTQENKQ